MVCGRKFPIRILHPEQVKPLRKGKTEKGDWKQADLPVA
jgi:hypothetical protein